MMRLRENLHMVSRSALIGPLIWFVGFLLMISLAVCELIHLAMGAL